MSARTSDPWQKLRRHTSARIALGRAGGSLPTAELLNFATAHAAARDAVHSELDEEKLEADLLSLGLAILNVSSCAPDRATYLQRPDLGRQLSESRAKLARTKDADIAIVVSDGLSALATQRHASTVLAHLIPLLRDVGLTLAPIVIVRHGRVAIEDEIGAILGVKAAIILLGERPGLGSPDSLGAYLVFNPKPGNTDADRNCVSNIRPEGLPPTAAAETLQYLITESLRLKISGVNLKDERTPLLAQPADTPSSSLVSSQH